VEYYSATKRIHEAIKKQTKEPTVWDCTPITLNVSHLFLVRTFKILPPGQGPGSVVESLLHAQGPGFDH
jgi:hypothetical protein